MKKISLLIIIVTLIISCQNKEATNTSTKELSVAQKIANAHGFQNWEKVKTFEFRFGGTIEDANTGRAWTWNPNTNDIKLINKGDTIRYNRSNMDSITIKSDRAFINDKFWALIPFQLVWDEGTTISDPENTTSPINQETLSKITITYPNEGGYTPGDAYDIYYNDDFIIKEWSYRKGNQSEPSLTNTFENYQDYNGLKIALEHKTKSNNWNLLIRNVKVTTKH